MGEGGIALDPDSQTGYLKKRHLDAETSGGGRVNGRIRDESAKRVSSKTTAFSVGGK